MIVSSGERRRRWDLPVAVNGSLGSQMLGGGGSNGGGLAGDDGAIGVPDKSTLNGGGSEVSGVGMAVATHITSTISNDNGASIGSIPIPNMGGGHGGGDQAEEDLQREFVVANGV